MTSINQTIGLRRVSARIAVLAVLLGAAFTATIHAQAADAATVERTTWVSAGSYRTLAGLWHTTAVGTFRCPAEARIRVRYGYGWLARNRQNQTLDCDSYKRLSVGAWSVLYARMQIKVPTSQYVQWTYTVDGP